MKSVAGENNKGGPKILKINDTLETETVAATITAHLPKDKPYIAPKEPVEWCKARLQDGATFRIPKITEAEVYLALTKINTRKNVGTDGINAKYLKIAAANISKQLTDIINTSLASNRFPEAWKVAKVFPVFKKGKKEDLDNYRPISILCTLSKMLERYVHKHLYAFLSSYRLLHPSHSGLGKYYFCENLSPIY